MFLSVYEYFSGPSTESTPLGSAIPLPDFFKSSGSPSPSGGNVGSPSSPITGNKYVCESEPGAGPYCKTRYFPSMLHRQQSTVRRQCRVYRRISKERHLLPWLITL